ncbi:MAG: hypothetical protein WBB82_10995 [Limnothrix sp.]
MAKKKAIDQAILNGLKASFYFLLVSLLMRYGILLSIFFAAVGGFTVGFILRWWKSTEPDRPKRNPLKRLKKLRHTRQYPGLSDISSHTSKKGSLANKQNPPETSLGDQ